MSPGMRTYFRIFKRWFRGTELLEELGDGQVLHEGRWFVVVRAAL
jgi:hypothetical protein